MSTINKIILYTFLLAALAACTTGYQPALKSKDYPAAFRSAGDADTSSKSIGSVSWRDFFTDSYLKAIIDTALINNQDIALGYKRIEMAEAYLKQAGARYFPSVSAGIEVSTSAPSANSLAGVNLETFLGQRNIGNYTAGLTASWEIDIWGKIRNRRKAAINDYLQSAEASRAIRTRIISTIAERYYNLLLLDAQLAVAEKNRLLSDSIVEMVQLQWKAGQSTSLAIQQVTSRRLAMDILVNELKNAIIVEENTIHVLMGTFPAGVKRSSLQEITFPSSYPAGIPASVLANRPDVKANELALRAAYARVGVAKASLYPTLTISAATGLNAFTAANWFLFPGSLFTTAAGGIFQPLFQRRELKTQLRIAQIEKDQVAIRFRQSVISAAAEVNDALVSLDMLNQKEKLIAEQVNIGSSSVANAKLLYTSGMADYLEVINAESNLLNAELDLQKVRSQKLVTVAELYRALGGGADAMDKAAGE